MPRVMALEEMEREPKRRAVVFEDGSRVDMELEIALQAGLLPGRDVPGDVIAEAVERDRLRAAETLALSLLNRKDRSEAHLRRELRKEFDEAVTDAVVRKCIEWGYVDDQRLAERLTRDSMRLKKLGPARVRQELKRRGITSEMADAVQKEQAAGEPPELDRAMAALASKRMTYGRLDREVAERRAVGFLQRRGFSLSVAFDAVRKFLDGAEGAGD